MKALSLSGPWAFYERKNAENEARIAQLESEALRSRHDAESLSAQLAEARAEAAALRTDAVPQLQDEAARARELAEQLQAELAAVRGDKATAQRELSEQVQGLSDELQRVTADCAVLRAELAKTVHARTSTASKLDIVRKKLGLTESEAKVFIQELDDTRQANKSLKGENATLAADKAHLQQQVDSRSQHCITLIADNKRLMLQVSDMREQLQRMDGDLWQARQELQAMQRQQQQLARKPVALRERPQSAHKPATAQDAGLQNRPPFVLDAAPRKPGTKQQQTQVQVPVGTPSAAGTDRAKAEAVRQALALRQQRLGSGS